MVVTNKSSMSRTALLTLFLLMSCTLCHANDKTPLPTVYLMDYLTAIGTKLDCYFTLEWHNKDEYSFIGYKIPDDPSVDSIKALIEKFRRDTPDIEAIQDTDNPVIVHLKTRAVQNSKDQALDQKATVSFNGRLERLPNEIAHRINGGVSSPRFFFPLIAMPDDLFTFVEVKAKDHSVRSILSDYMPLSRYSPLLWLAIKESSRNGNFIQVFHYGTVVYKPYTGLMNINDSKGKPTVYPFTDGRNAYFLNPFSDKLTDEATQFVTDGFQSGKTLNVRWSMYYLGKHKVESAIPLLLSHLDYRYTTVPVLAEAYPAVHALLDMGKPATAAIQKQLTTETNPLRLQLLCAVLLGIHGAYDGRRLTAETAAKLSEAREKPIMDALRVAEEQIIAVPPPVDNVSFPNPAPLAP